MDEDRTPLVMDTKVEAIDEKHCVISPSEMNDAYKEESSAMKKVNPDIPDETRPFRRDPNWWEIFTPGLQPGTRGTSWN